MDFNALFSHHFQLRILFLVGLNFAYVLEIIILDILTWIMDILVR